MASNDKVTFSPATWIGLLSIALVPAVPLAGWGYAMSQRVTILETNQATIMRGVEKLSERDDRDRIIRLEGRLESIEGQLQQK